MGWLDNLADIRKTDWSKIPEPERDATANEVIQIASYAAAATAVVPIPLLDAALLLPVHTAMVMTVGHVYGRKLSDAEAKRVALELGAVAGVALAGRAALSALKKLVMPMVGGFLAASGSFAVTYALGRVAVAYFKDPELSREDLKRVFSEAFKEGESSYEASETEAPKDGDDVPEEVVEVDAEAVAEAEDGPSGPSDPSKLRTKKRSL